MDFLQKLGLNIKRIRELQEMTQANLAENADVSISTIARLEIGQGFSTFKTIEKIAKALKVQVETIFDVSAIEKTSVNEENFIKELKRHSKFFKSNKDYEFILEVIRAYAKSK